MSKNWWFRRRLVQKVSHFGLANYCPVCSSHLRHFIPYKRSRRFQPCCPVCGSFTRHRFACLFMRRRLGLFSPGLKRMLQVGPEPFLTPLFAKCASIDFASLDIARPATIHADLTRLCFANDTFDVIYVSHVLEQIRDDRAGLREIRRTLRPGGYALLQDPIVSGPTREDTRITDPEEQARQFGHPYRFRVYGDDYFDRLTEAGLFYTKYQAATEMSDKEIQKYGLAPHDQISVCTRVA